MYEHPDVSFTLEFPSGPLAVGNEVLNEWNTIHTENRRLQIVFPTDCVRDRLAAAIHWRDEKSLEQAVAVARRQNVDLEKIERWCDREGGKRTFDRFLAELA